MRNDTFIKIVNYGPLKDGTSDLKNGFLRVSKFTFLIGDQGSGKSTVAKLFSSFTWIEKTLVKRKFDKDLINYYYICIVLRNQNLPEEYITDDTVIEYIGSAFIIKVANKEVTIRERDRENEYVCPQIIYFPSERNILSVLGNPWEVRGLPEMLVHLATEYLNAQRTNNREKPLFCDYKIEFDPISKTSYVLDPDKNTRIPLPFASSGLQSVAPLIVVSDYLMSRTHEDLLVRMKNESISARQKILESISDVELKNKLDSYFSSYQKDCFTQDDIVTLEKIAIRYVNSTLIEIVEEPEQNLYPTSQVSIIQKLVENTNKGGKLLITTHSPYILSAVNNYIFANDLKDDIRGDIKNLSPKYYIPFEEITASKIVDGKIISIEDEEARMIDVSQIDGCSDDINDLFDALMEIKDQRDESQNKPSRSFPKWSNRN